MYSLAASFSLLMPLKAITKKTLGDRAFASAAPKLWNKLPCAIRGVGNFNRFKTLVKSYLNSKIVVFLLPSKHSACHAAHA